MHQRHTNAKLIYQLEMNGKIIQSGRCKANIPACDSMPQGMIAFKVPKVQQRCRATVRLALMNNKGKILHDTSKDFAIFPEMKAKDPKRYYIPQGSQSQAAKLVRQLGGKGVCKGHIKSNDTVVISNPKISKQLKKNIASAVNAGAIVVYLELTPGVHIIADSKVEVTECGMGRRHFVSQDTNHPLVMDFEPEDFKFWYDSDVGYPTPILESVVRAGKGMGCNFGAMNYKKGTAFFALKTRKALS